ncbi:NADPH:quinone oxidoreductase family protein [Rhizobium sp. C4]|uniref:NADPH:quinone oxidoreductase family protein n=1 Tax=Rhizobium sp. C4 TaxID=1349800 RepID=UPI001E601D46|nr:NADPH:quinone oxidoreductase family protein [Rhizobium sp. C4]MCD2172237.1 NADPH:quinone oxidoreductase family protein [Rhizobium sp. C4]
MADEEDMRAVIVSAYGDWREAHFGRSARPQPMADQVLIRTEAAAINFPDLLMIEGKYQVKPALPFVPGRDVAGTIIATGADVRGFKVGDRVAAQPQFGAFAEYVAAPDWSCIRLPDRIGFADGAACGTVIATVVGAMRLRARLKPGEWVLLTGATGGVGSAGIQYARHLGARVVALVSSDQKEAAARRLGAEIVLRSDKLEPSRNGMKEALLEQGLRGVDAVVDVVGGDAFEGAIRCLVPGGRYVVVGFASGQIPQIPANYVLVKDLVVLGSTLDRLFRLRDPELAAGIEDAFEALAAGKMEAEIDSVLPFSKFAEGAEKIASRRAVGKIVLQGFGEVSDDR